MKPHWFHILLALVDDDRHGAAIAEQVRASSTDTVVLWPVTLYGSLAELEEQGWIASLSNHGAHPRGQSERRKYYRLTRTGRQALAAETRRLAALVSAAERRLHPKEAM